MTPFALLFILSLIIILSGIILLRKSILSPLAIVYCSWCFVFIGLFFLDLGLYNVTDRLLFLYSLWLIFFSLGSLFSNIIKIKHTSCINNVSYNESLFSVLYKLLIIIIPVLIYKIVRIMMLGGEALISLRMAATGKDIEVEGIGFLNYFSPLAIILFLAELYRLKPCDSRIRLLVLLFINFLFAFSSMAKVSVIFIIIPSIIILSFKKQIKVKQIMIIVCLLITILISIQQGKGINRDLSLFEALVEMLKVYIFAGVPAMDQVLEENVSSGLWGEHVFMSFYKLLNVLGFDFIFDEGDSFVGTGGYAMVPFYTNVFTVLYVFYVDFGVVGIIVFAFFTGFLTSYLYRLALNKQTWALILYAYFATSLSLQFFDDFIFSMLSLNLQLMFWAYFIYHSRLKYKFVFIKKVYKTLDYLK